MRVSVALCTFNGRRYLSEQLRSLADQTRRPDELVVCDDHSADGTPDLLAAFAATAPFPVHVHRNATTLGTTANFERAISLCTCDVIFLCDQDDVWAAEKVARFEAEFAAHPEASLVASDLDVIDATGAAVGRRVWESLPFTRRQQAVVREGQGPRLWLRYNTLTGAALAFRADLRDVLLPIPPCWHHDAWIAFIAGALSSVRLIPDPLTHYRIHGGQQIGSEPRTLGREIASARRFDAAYFARVAECFTVAADRLGPRANLVRDPVLLSLTRTRAEFARVQQRMRAGGRLGRVAPAVRALVAGRYHRFARGWKSFAADLFL